LRKKGTKAKLSGMEKPQLPAEILEKIPEEVRTYIGYLESQIAELQARLNQNSQNSSKPPSSDLPSVPARPPKKPTGRKRSGQKGHKKHIRQLELSEKVNLEQEYYPSRCSNPKCKALLSYRDQIGTPIRQQVWEIALSPVQITEHRYYRCECPFCQTETVAPHPPDIPAGNFGVNLVALVGVLHGRYRVSMGEVVTLLEAMWGLKISKGMVAKMCEQTSQALATPYTEAHAAIKATHQNNVDETSWKLAGQKYWLWVAAAEFLSVFYLAKSRSRTSFEALVGKEYGGIVTSDRYNAYAALEAHRHQFCWAHLVREIRGLSQRKGAGGEWGLTALSWVEQLFEAWYWYRDGAGTITVGQLAAKLAPIRAGFLAHLEVGKTLPDGKVRCFCEQLLKGEQSLWVFSTTEGIEPTNNAAERALRPAVIWRKSCFGSQSEKELRFVERILTAAATCQKRGKDLLSFVANALKADWFNAPAPSLI
jgi:transposase